MKIRDSSLMAAEVQEELAFWFPGAHIPMMYKDPSMHSYSALTLRLRPLPFEQ